MPKVVIDEGLCKGCELCISVCPRKLIDMSESFNTKSYHFAYFKPDAEDRCNSCTLCARICPDVAIEVFDSRSC